LCGSHALTLRSLSLLLWLRQIPLMFETLAKLVNADKLRLEYTEYELSTEFTEALEHAQESGRGTKVILRVNDVGVSY